MVINLNLIKIISILKKLKPVKFNIEYKTLLK